MSIGLLNPKPSILNNVLENTLKTMTQLRIQELLSAPYNYDVVKGSIARQKIDDFLYGRAINTLPGLGTLTTPIAPNTGGVFTTPVAANVGGTFITPVTPQSPTHTEEIPLQMPQFQEQFDAIEQKPSFDLSEADLSTEGGKVSKPLWEMSIEEVDELIAKTKEADKNIEVKLFGEEGAKKYARLYRQANQYIDIEKADQASEELVKMENLLTKEQQNLLFGIGQENVIDIDSLKNYRRAVAGIEGDTPKELGSTLSHAITNVGDKTNPMEMNSTELQAFGQIKRAFEIAIERGWSTKDVGDAAIKASASRFSDPEDAKFMLQRFLKVKKIDEGQVANRGSQKQLLSPTEGGKVYYHRTNKDFSSKDILPSKSGALGEGIYLSKGKDDMTSFGKNVHEFTLAPDTKLLKIPFNETINKDAWVKRAKAEGYDGVNTDLGEIVIFNKSKLSPTEGGKSQ